MQTHESLKQTTWECKYHVVFILILDHWFLISIAPSLVIQHDARCRQYANGHKNPQRNQKLEMVASRPPYTRLNTSVYNGQ